jgi:hypothetical protein
MQLLGALLGGSFVLASLFVGLRLVWLAQETRKSPELLVGAGLILLSVLGYPMMTVARKAEALTEPTRIGVAIAAALCLAVGGFLMVLFVRRVFRQDAPWTTWLAAGYAGIATAVFVSQTDGPGWWAWVSEQRGSWAGARWLFLVPIGWGAVESLRYWTLLRRRLVLGLADPIVVDRFRLFGIAMSAGLVANTATVICQILGIEIVGTVAGTVAVSPASIAAVALWLAFLPPRTYLARVQRIAARA